MAAEDRGGSAPRLIVDIILEAKPKPKLTDKQQSERFIETARKLGVDESGKKFETALRSVFSQKQSKR
jgi:hypothetical protein